MLDLKDCTAIGTITKVHGVRGQVMLRLDHLNFDDIIKMETVFIEIDGLPVPFFVKEIIEKNFDSVILSLENIDSETHAREILSCRLSIRTKNLKAKNKPTELDELFGFEVYDQQHGRLGVIQELQNIHQNPLFRILDGKKEYLIPAQSKFIVSLDSKNKKIILDTPPGLIDLF